MPEKIVIGLFASKGIAEDARNRLRTEGVPDADLCVRLLHETAPAPSYVEPEVAPLSVDPLLWSKVRESHAPLIHNGESALFVRAAAEADIDRAVDTIKQYAPVQISVADGSRVQDVVIDPIQPGG